MFWNNDRRLEFRQQVFSRVEEEYGEPIGDVVKGFREMGYSFSFIASVFEISPHTFRKWCKLYDWLDGKRVYNRGELHNSLDKKARALGFEDTKQLVTVYRHAQWSRLQIAELLDCHPMSLYRHTPPEAKYLNFITDRQKEVRRKLVGEINRKRQEARGGL